MRKDTISYQNIYKIESKKELPDTTQGDMERHKPQKRQKFLFQRQHHVA